MKSIPLVSDSIRYAQEATALAGIKWQTHGNISSVRLSIDEAIKQLELVKLGLDFYEGKD